MTFLMRACLDVPLEIRINDWDQWVICTYLWGILGFANPVILTFFTSTSIQVDVLVCFWIFSSGGGQ